MSAAAVLPLTLGGMVALAAIAPLLSRPLRRSAGYPLAAAYGLAALALGSLAPEVLDGGTLVASAPWFSSMGVELSLVLDGLSLLFSLLVLGIGALVMAYSARYFGREAATGRTYGLITVFAASMLGLVLAGDVILLFVFWELTSVTSFFLIAGEGTPESRGPALRAFLVTAVGGLALFAGLVLLAIAGGTSSIPDLLAGDGALRGHPFAGAVLVLVLLGAFTKSAQVPFQFWLPGAMVAPTPISTYLHAATMVKAGLYLVARLGPLFAGEAAFVYAVVLVGLVTAVVGAALALRQYDLKALLAYSTVSQLGFIMALLGLGTEPAMIAAVLLILAHAAYKATLFMVAGIIDHEAETRDIRNLSGLRRAMPWTATVATLAALSMAGLPPFLGFVSKEEAFVAFLEAPGGPWLAPLATALAVGAAILTFAYSARFLHGAFGGLFRDPVHRPPATFLAPAAITAAAGLVLGLLGGRLDAFVSRAAAAGVPEAVEAHVALFHGATPALGLSGLTILAGTMLFLLRRPIDRLALRSPVSGDAAFDRLHAKTVALGKATGRPFLSPAPGHHLLWILASTAAAGLWAWATFGHVPDVPAPSPRTEDWLLIALLVPALAAASSARIRLAAVATVGVSGFLVAFLWVLLGAPDVALTQFLVETLAVVLVVLVFRRLPTRFHPVRLRRRLAAGATALVVGLLAGVGTFLLTGRRGLSEPARYYLETSLEEAGGHNVVNVILVDFRALDTLGEITVLVVAAVGAAAIVRTRRRFER